MHQCQKLIKSVVTEEEKMEWTRFNTHGESPNRAFEVMCNILFEGWCNNLI